MDELAKQPDNAEAPHRGVSQTRQRKAVWASIASAFVAVPAPVLERIANHQVGIRRWGGLGSLAVGVGFMAGGLEPAGLSLILVGVAVLLVELERSRQGTSDRKRK